MTPANIIALIVSLFGFICLLLVVIRTRRRVDRQLRKIECGETTNTSTASRAVENHLVKLVEMSREIEARVQNKIELLQNMLEDADLKLQELRQTSGTNVTRRPQRSSTTPPIYEQVISLSRSGKSDREIGEILSRTEGEIRLVRSLGQHSLSESIS